MKKKITFVLLVSMLTLIAASTSIMAGARQGMGKASACGTRFGVRQADKIFGEGFAGKDFMFGGKDLTLEELSEKLAALIEEGRITQEMADAMIARHKEMLENPDTFRMREGFKRSCPFRENGGAISPKFEKREKDAQNESA